MMMRPVATEEAKNENERGDGKEEDYRSRNPRSTTDPENNNSSNFEERGNFTTIDGINEERRDQLTEKLERPAVDQKPTIIDRFMRVVGNPVGTFFGLNKQLEEQERARAIKQWQQEALHAAFNQKREIFNITNLGPSEMADLLQQVKEEEVSRGQINESDVIDRLIELAEQKGGEGYLEEFIFKNFDESLRNLEQSFTLPGTATAAPVAIEQSEQEQAQQLVTAAKNTPIFSKIFRPKRLKWCLSWALSRGYSQTVLDEVQVLANRDGASFGTPQEEKTQYQLLYKAQGAKALENEFIKLLAKQSSELGEVAFNDPNEIADLLMTVRLQFRSVVLVSASKIDLEILSLAKAQGDLVRDALYYKIFDQSLDEIQFTRELLLGRNNRSLSSPELAEQLIKAVKRSSLFMTIPKDKRLSYCSKWARSRLASEEILNLIDYNWSKIGL